MSISPVKAPGRIASSRSSGRTTLATVAARAGVSTMTASRALNHPELVSDLVRERVRAAAAALAYVPNRAARSLASARSGVILVLVPSLSNAVFAPLLDGLEEALEPANYQLLIGNTRYSDAHEEKLFAAHLQSNPDGVLFCGLQRSASMAAMLDAARLPSVAMMDLSDQPGQLSVGFSQVDAGYALTRHLIDSGRKRIAFAGAQLDERTLRRADGYRKAVREAGLHDPRLELMLPAPSSVAFGADMLDRILADTPDCDAIFFCNDDLAQGAVFRCQRRAIDVPGQLAICGFNDIAPSAWMQPSLTTVATPRYQIGFEAGMLLRQLIDGKTPATTRIDLGFTLMLRESA
ncbi:MAG TPA: LacI family DNA-binding transcriptional regulator [Telluria sp.]